MPIQFLVDECLHVSLPRLAHARQYAASHVVHVGLGGADDAVLLARMLREDEVLCTNNARDFAGVLGEQELHPGLVVFEENTFAALQRRLFSAVLDHVEGRRDLINRMLYVGLDAASQELHEPAHDRRLSEAEKQELLRIVTPRIREEERPRL